MKLDQFHYSTHLIHSLKLVTQICISLEKKGSPISSRRLGAIWHCHADFARDSQNIAKEKKGFVISLVEQISLHSWLTDFLDVNFAVPAWADCAHINRK